MTRSIHDYINECRANLENLKGKDAENAELCLCAISSEAHTLARYVQEKEAMLTQLDKLAKELIPADCYLTGIYENRGRVVNSKLDAPFNAYVSLSHAGQTLHKLIEGLKK